MTGRVNRYYQHPASRDLVIHFREEIGLAGDYLRIFDDLRGCSGDTQLHADNIGITVKNYNAMANIVGGVCISELIRLAEIGFAAETAMKAT